MSDTPERSKHAVRRNDPIGDPELRAAFDALHAAMNCLSPQSSVREKMADAVWTLRRYCTDQRMHEVACPHCAAKLTTGVGWSCPV